MSALQHRFLTCAGKALHIETWGNPQHPAVLVWHGITGTAGDHRDLAKVLSRNHYVICPDALGCGQSDWPSNSQQTSLAFQSQLTDEMLSQLGIEEVAWVGTSKGGMLGIYYAAHGKQCRLTKLVLHEVGPQLPEKIRGAVAKHIGQLPVFETLPQFQSHLEKALARGGLSLSPNDWQALARRWQRRTDNGQITFHYAPLLAQQMLDFSEDFDLWALYEQITVDTLLIVGEQGSILPKEQVERMCHSGPSCHLHRRGGGHISFLNTAEEQDPLLSFLSHE